MNRAIKALRAAFTTVLAVLCAWAASAQTLKLPPHEKIVLKNGMTVLLMEKRGVPMVSVAAIIKAGAVADPAGEDGLASVTAGLLRKGTAARCVSRRTWILSARNSTRIPAPITPRFPESF